MLTFADHVCYAPCKMPLLLLEYKLANDHFLAIVQRMFILCGTFGFNKSKLKLIDRHIESKVC